MGGSSGGSKPESTEFKPWKGQQRHLVSIYGDARKQYETADPWTYYPGDSIANEDPASAEALAARYARAVGGSDLTRGSQDYTQRVMGGEFLNNNPYIDATYNRAADAVTKRFHEATLPAIDTRFGGSGRLGGGAYNYALGRAGQGLAGELGNLATDIYGQNYARERGFQDQASRFAPQLAEADYNDINQLASVGAAREGRAQTEIDDLIARFNYAQEEPSQRLARYSNLIGAPIGSVSSAASKTNWANNLGRAALDPLNFSGLFQ